MSNEPRLSAPRATALYIGALLGPSVLLLPGLAAKIAGPASILAWLGLLLVSGLLAYTFTALGTRVGGSAGVAGYTSAGLGRRAGTAAGWCFLAGVIVGAPVVCLIGGGYLANLLGGDKATTVRTAAVLLLVVIAVTMDGVRASTAVQLVLVAVLIGLIAVAIAGSVRHASLANWAPFAPHGWTSVGGAASALMLSFVGWEAIAPLTGRLRRPERSLPKVIGAAFAVTAIVYIGLAAATVAVLGSRAGSAVPLADLLAIAVGGVGPVIAAIAAVALTLAATNAYISGATALFGQLRGQPSGKRIQLAIAGTGLLVLGVVAVDWVDIGALVNIPTTLFLTVYLGCTVAATRILTGPARIAAALAGVAVLAVLGFSGWPLVGAALVAAVGYLAKPRQGGVLESVSA